MSVIGAIYWSMDCRTAMIPPIILPWIVMVVMMVVNEQCGYDGGRQQ